MSVRCNYNKIVSELGSSKIPKANLVDDPYDKIQLQTEFQIYLFIKKIFLHALG